MKITLTIAILIVLSLSCKNKSPEIYEFRGPDRTGVFNETQLLKIWPEEGPEELFYIDSIGNGYGSPVICDKLLYFTGSPDSTAMLYCADIEGNMVWSYELGPEWVKNYPGSRSTPTIAGDLIYVGTGMGNLYCINRKKNALIWSINLLNDFQGELPVFGHSESPVVFQDMVFWTAGGKSHNVVAIDRFTGEIIWSNEGMKDRSAYHPPRVITSKSGREILVTFSAYHLLGFDIHSGELLWIHEQDNYPVEERKPGNGDTHSNTVLYEDGFIYYAAGDGNCGVKLRLSDDGAEIEEIWRNKGFDSYMGGIIKIGDHLYGSATVKPQLRSIHTETGVLTDSLSIGRGVVIAADSMIFYYNQQGKMHLISFNDGKMKSVSSFSIERGTREHFSHPLIHDGVLYLRRGNTLMAYQIK
jgi:outer membrane protein assembly factor BamB